MFQLVNAIIGFIVCEVVSHPGKKVRKSLPRLKLWRFEIFPCLRYHGRRRTFHLHHWFFMPILLIISIPLDWTFLDSPTTRSFLFGGTLQGWLINHKSHRLIYQNPLEQSDEYR